MADPSTHTLNSSSATPFLLAVLLALLSIPAVSWGQSPTGTITGHVSDSQGKAVAGATITVESPNLQQAQKTTSASNGGYIFKLLPPGTYVATFQSSGFAPVKKTFSVAAAEPVAVDAMFQPAAQVESVTVVPETLPFLHTVQQSTNLSSSLMAELPTSRSQLAAVSLAPSAHQTGPGNAFSIAGAMSFENLFLVNGVEVQDNLRGTPLPLVIEDAIQETTISSAGVSAEYGRFTGGVINTITKSGGNRFSGSWRTNLSNDSWRSASPFEEPKNDDVAPAHEYTFGGPILTDRLWFFAAGRNSEQALAKQTGYTNTPYVYRDKEARGELKLTGSLSSTQRVEFAYTGIRQEQQNNAWPSPAEVMDLASLTTRDLPQNLAALHYTGSFGSNLFLEGQFSRRTFAFQGDGGLSTNLATGTPLLDQTTGAFWHAPNFCGVCPDERRDNNSLALKGSYFLTTGFQSSHTLTFGYDGFNDQRTVDNYQSATDYHVYASASLIENGTIYPVFDPNTFIVHWPVQEKSQGTNFRTHGLYLNDTWSASRHFSFNLGLRYDKNQGRDASGTLVANDSAFSPRLGLVFDPTGDGRTTYHASYGRYVSAVANGIASAGSAAGTPSVFAYFYDGPAINAGDGPLVSGEAALQQVFDWFNAANPDPFYGEVPGLVTHINGSLKSPHADEFTVGIGHQIGSRGAIRADFVNRAFGDFYATRKDLSTGIVMDEFGQEFDRALVENTNEVSRQYRGLDLQGSYRTARLQLGASYTISRLFGNINGENEESGPLTSSVLSYPEYFERSWRYPTGALGADQRHRARVFGTYTLPSDRLGTFSIGFIEQLQSGTPYGAVGAVDVSPFVDNPGYALPDFMQSYAFTPRDEFRTEAMMRTDLSLNFQRALSSRHSTQVFAQLQLLNVFNQFQVFNAASGNINATVLTAVDDPDRFATFNPFAETPVQGTHWDYGDQFGKPVGKDAYTLPRTFRMSFGLRF